ncbi:MAG: NAD(P)/FAD-dependent oxidoreductase [Rhizobiales bacterium]|nr:NAD(P)/FAD-dependent oxidoreductase [Hyphomicrobiales bacterium]
MTDERTIPQSDRSKPTVSIVGAGPSGFACAIALARAGYSVIVHEQRTHVGGRFHGDFQGLENWSSEDDILQELRRSGIEPTFDYHAVSAGIGFDAWGKRYDIRSKSPLYYLVQRGSDHGALDQSLLTQAQALGVDVRFSDRVKQVDGLAVLAGGPRTADAIAAGYVFDTDMADGDWVCFDNELAPLGYSYLLVHRGRGTVASCMFTGFKREAEYVTRTIATFRDRAGLTMRNEKRFGGYANFRLPRTAVQGGHLVVGEQAGFQDALAGFGMRYALRSGILAARSIIENVDYTMLWRQELLPFLKTGVANRFLFNCVGERGWRWILKNRLEGTDSRESLQRLYGKSSWTRIFFPIAYWRYRAPLKDNSCDHQHCSCVWCRCCAEEAAAEVHRRRKDGPKPMAA